MSRRAVVVGAAASLGLVAASPAAAQSYPQRPVKIIMAGLPGAPFDLVARAIADKLSPSLRADLYRGESRRAQPAISAPKSSPGPPPDGYTLSMALGTTFTVNPSLYKKLPFDPHADFRFISIRATTQQHAGRASVRPRQFGGGVRRIREERADQPMRTAATARRAICAWSISAFWPASRRCRCPTAAIRNWSTDLVAGQIKFGFVAAAA